MSPPRVVSVNVGRPRLVQWHGRPVQTSIWKQPVDGPAQVGALNIVGDEQSDLSVHGGSDKAVYAYPREHYDYWRELWPDVTLDGAAFGENLAIEGLLESDLRLGDRLTIGSVEFEVRQPRFPCFKLGIRLGRDDLLKPFLASGRSGFYLSVIREGRLAANDPIALDPRAQHDVTIADVTAAYATGGSDRNLLRRVLEAPELPSRLRDHFTRLLADA